MTRGVPPRKQWHGKARTMLAEVHQCYRTKVFCPRRPLVAKSVTAQIVCLLALLLYLLLEAFGYVEGAHGRFLVTTGEFNPPSA